MQRSQLEYNYLDFVYLSSHGKIMNITLSNRVKAVKPSPTLAITARAAEMRTVGKDIIGLGAGEPDFDTPDHIKAAAVKAIDEGFTKYTAVDGTPSLKQAIINKFKQDNGFDYQLNQILVSSGGKQSFFNLAQALLNPGDEVVIPAPYWVSYPDMVLLAEGKPVIVEAPQSQNFKISPDLVIVGNVIAWPIAYFAMKRWLQGFAYRVDINLLIFISSGLLALGIAVLTVSYQAIRAAIADPVEALRYE